MKTHTTEELFLSVISTAGIHHQLGMSSNAVRSIRARLRKDQWPSKDKMHEIIQLAGYSTAYQHTWVSNKQKSKITYAQKKLRHLLTDPDFDQDLIDFLTPLLSKD